MNLTVPDIGEAPYWTVDNPQAVGAADPLPLPPDWTPWQPTIVPDTTPPPDGEVQYPGQGAVQLWSDVYGYAKSIVSFFGRSGPSISYVTSDVLNQAIDSAVGSTIKSLSGFISTAHQLALDAQQWASKQLDALDANIGAIYSYFDHRVSAVEGAVKAIEGLALPALQAQISQLAHDTALGFQYNSAVDRQWATDNIFKPLTDELGNVARDIPIWADGALQHANTYTDVAVGALGADVLRQLVTHAQQLQALAQESTDCTQPMCEMIGPKTDLGKLLKGLKIAGEVAALTAILNMNEHDLANLIHAVTSHLAAVVGDIEQFTGTGGETVAGLIAAATRDLV